MTVIIKDVEEAIEDYTALDRNISSLLVMAQVGDKIRVFGKSLAVIKEVEYDIDESIRILYVKYNVLPYLDRKYFERHGE